MHTPTFMVVPSLACQASCKYCFGPHQGAVMEQGMAQTIAKFMRSIAEETGAREVTVIFHGGEPLMAPYALWETLLASIKTELSAFTLRLNLQSNLWNLTDDILILLKTHGVTIGTSLDGPEDVCDRNRGKGYYARTMAGIERARRGGCTVSGIATVTKQTAGDILDIAKFFRNRAISLVLHGAVQGMDGRGGEYALEPMEYADMIKRLYPWYIKNRKHMRIDTLNHGVQGLVMGKPGVCTYRDCFGMFLAIGPTGDITACQRLAGRPEFVMGNVGDMPSLEDLYASPPAVAHRQREAAVRDRCSECREYSICKGGCYYNAMAAGDGVVDPLCEGYKEVYAFVRRQLLEEMQSQESLEALVQAPGLTGNRMHALLRKGPYISLVGDLHPATIADNARRALAIHALGKFQSETEAAQYLYDEKICGDVTITGALLRDMKGRIQAGGRMNNCYIHITFDCNLRCSHCYAMAGERKGEMTPEALERLLFDVLEAGFDKAVITGGEPLIHSRWPEVVQICESMRCRGLRIALRTNLTGAYSEEEILALSRAFDQVVVSIDGDSDTHDERRGKGTYDVAVRNMRTYVEAAGSRPGRGSGELSIATVLSAAEIKGEPGQSVEALAHSLGVDRIRFRPMLPIGRAANREEPLICEGLMAHISPAEALEIHLRPMATCGIGQNLFIHPDGNAYPCYAWCGPHTHVGNVEERGLFGVLSSDAFTRLAKATVDTVERCRDCEYRYLCGGACRAFGNQGMEDINAPPLECSHLQKRAMDLIDEARRYLEI